MATSEAALQVLSASFPRFCGLNGVISSAKCTRRRGGLATRQGFSASRIAHNELRINASKGTKCVLCRRDGVHRLESMSCECLRAKCVNGTSASGVDGSTEKPQLKNEERSPGFDGNRGSSGAIGEELCIGRENGVEEEAWKLLKESVVYYCNTPVGTIAANDPSSSSTLNYDQVFIRDFVPSGIASF